MERTSMLLSVEEFRRLNKTALSTAKSLLALIYQSLQLSTKLWTYLDDQWRDQISIPQLPVVTPLVPALIEQFRNLDSFRARRPSPELEIPSQFQRRAVEAIQEALNMALRFETFYEAAFKDGAALLRLTNGMDKTDCLQEVLDLGRRWVWGMVKAEGRDMVERVERWSLGVGWVEDHEDVVRMEELMAEMREVVGWIEVAMELEKEKLRIQRSGNWWEEEVRKRL